jgi:ATP-dependent Clp protease adapter protein ClpS
LLRHQNAESREKKVDTLRMQIKVDKHARVIIDNDPYNFM